jgi:hypothetical protein
MFNVIDLPSVTYGNSDASPEHWHDRPARNRDFLQLGVVSEQYADLVAQVESRHTQAPLLVGETWQRRLCVRIGERLVVLGRSIESYGKRSTLEGPAELGSH